MSDRPVADPFTRQQTTPTQETDIHALGGIQNRNQSKRKAADTLLIPRGQWSRQRHTVT